MLDYMRHFFSVDASKLSWCQTWSDLILKSDIFWE